MTSSSRCSSCSIFPLLILVLAAIAVLYPTALSSLNNAGPHGLSEILYAYVSTAGNNGSAFAGLNANTNWYNLTLALSMLAGRFMMKVPMLALAGNLALKKSVPPSSGTFPVNTTAVHRAAGWRDLDCRRADVFPRIESGSDPRTPVAPRRERLSRACY